MRKNQAGSRRRGASDGGTHWISYSDMMASLLLVFIMAVCMSIYQYHTLLETKTREMGEQQAKLDAAQVTLAQKEEDLETTRVELMGKEEELSAIQIQLENQEADLNAAQVKLNAQEAENNELLAQIILKETDLADQQNKIAALQIVLAAQEEDLENYQLQLADILGVRTKIVKELSAALSQANISASVDANTGDILLDSTLMFETNSADLKADGQTQISRLIPVYLNVLMQPEYRAYVAEIIIEGHTDSTGSYESNLQLSQERALGVAMYCLKMSTLSADQKTFFKQVVTAQGRSYSNLIYDQYGAEDLQRSRRVEIKFRLKDAEMIEQMSHILSGLE